MTIVFPACSLVASLACAVLVGIGSSMHARADDPGQKSGRTAAIAAIAEDKEGSIEVLIWTWAALIEDAGGHPSQLASTLRAADPETLLQVSEAESLAEINRILHAR